MLLFFQIKTLFIMITKLAVQLILIMLVGTDVCVRWSSCGRKLEYPEETHLSDLVTTWPSHMPMSGIEPSQTFSNNGSYKGVTLYILIGGDTHMYLRSTKVIRRHNSLTFGWRRRIWGLRYRFCTSNMGSGDYLIKQQCDRVRNGDR